MNDLRSPAGAWDAMRQEIEAIEERQEKAAQPLEKAAHKLLRYTRAGQYPSVRAVKDDRVIFAISNGIDHGDDFVATLTFDQLEQGG